MKMDTKLFAMSPKDNCYVVKEKITQGTPFLIADKKFIAKNDIGIGFKIANQNIKQGEKIIKQGIDIGSATTNIEIGTVIHTNNLKSNYIPTYVKE